MSIPLRPEDIEIPEDDPFKNDLLDRKKPAEVLTGVVSSFRGPAVVAIDAAWGAGKTTFLRMWSRQLRKDGFTIVEFNAWDTDFAADPLLALSAELQAGLKSSGADIPPKTLENIKRWSTEILRHGAPQLARLAFDAVPLAGSLSEKLAESVLTHFTESRVSGYTKTKEAIFEFRSALAGTAAAVSESSETKPLVVIIDELDRCRPTYAVELLETAKHLFSVDHVVFVLAINRAQLVQSIRALYGTKFDADTYLRRFIDADIHLPKTDREGLIRNALAIVGLQDVHTGRRDTEVLHEVPMATDTLVGIFRMSAVGTRIVLQTIHRLGLVLESTPNDHRVFLFAAAVATVVLGHDVILYRKLSQRRASDEEAIEAVRKHCSVHDWNASSATPFFEAAIIRLVMDQSDIEAGESRTPQFAAYAKTLDANPEPSDGRAQPIEIRRLRQIQRLVERWRDLGGPKGPRLSAEFNIVFGRSDMISGVAPENRFRP